MAIDDFLKNDMGLSVVDVGRNDIKTTVEDVVHNLIFEAVEKQTEEINAVTSGQLLESGRHVEDAITDLIIEVARMAFDMGCKFSGVLLQVDAACDSMLRDYAGLVEDNGEG